LIVIYEYNSIRHVELLQNGRAIGGREKLYNQRKRIA